MGVASVGMLVDADGVCHLPCHWQQTVGNHRDYLQAASSFHELFVLYCLFHVNWKQLRLIFVAMH